jgi:hypothetical protein
LGSGAPACLVWLWYWAQLSWKGQRLRRSCPLGTQEYAPADPGIRTVSQGLGLVVLRHRGGKKIYGIAWARGLDDLRKKILRG